MLRPMLILGTRPEAIKMAPIIHACREAAEIDPIVCFTAQHRQMLDQMAEYFQLTADVDLNLMQPGQTPATFTAHCLAALDAELARCRPDCVVAQGDTTTVLCGSMAAFYRGLPFIHVEAGLRTGNLQSPWPEEYNRRAASLATTIHCAPTQRAADNLAAEGVSPDAIRVTGNSVVDALLWTLNRERNNDKWAARYEYLGDRRMVLVTGHRRESISGGLESVCRAIRTLAERFSDVVFLYPVHLNPGVRETVFRILGAEHRQLDDRNRPQSDSSAGNIYLIEPAAYPEFVWLMDRAELIITDSGGVQEEAPSLRKPVVVTRDITERPEVVELGAVQLVGTDCDRIVSTVERLLENEYEYARCQIDRNPYGDGRAANRIVSVMHTLGRDSVAVD